MKKVFTIAALVGAAVFANAADVMSLYIAGAQGTEINGSALGNWDIVNTLKVDLNRGKFVMNIKNFSTIAISDKKLSTASWGDWSTGLWSYTDAVNLSEADLGKALPLSGPGAGNLSAPWEADEWTIEISSDLKTITFNTTTPKPKDTVHLLGDGKIGWSVSDRYKFENESGTNVYWLDIFEADKISGPIGNINIIRNNSWETWWGAPTKPLALDGSSQEWLWKGNASGEHSIPEGSSYWGTIRFEMPENGQPAAVTMYTKLVPHTSVPTGVGEISKDEDVETMYYNMQGIRIDTPERGNVYIVRQGSNVKKVLM